MSFPKRLSASLVKGWPGILSGLLVALAIPPINLFLLVFVALVPWLRSLRELTPREARRSGAGFGLVFFGAQMLWLFPFVGRWTGSLGLASLPWIVTVGLQIPYFMLLGALSASAYRAGRPWMVPFIWVAIEAGRSYIPVLAFPHGLLASPLYVMPELIQLSAFGTVYAVSAWIVLVNVTIAEILAQQEIRKTARLVIAVIALMAISIWQYQQPIVGAERMVGIGQVGEDLAFGDPDTEPERVKAAFERLTTDAFAQGSEFLVLPEGLTKGGPNLPPAAPFHLPPALPTIFGGHRVGPDGKGHQSCFCWDGKSWSVADKSRLVIFGEFVPLRDQLPFLRNFNLPSGDLVPGEGTKTLDISGVKVGPVICFEAMFFDIAQKQAENGARLLAVQSIDDWYMGSGMPEQLFAATAFRAAENGLPVARAASMGISAAFDAKGRILSKAPIGEQRAFKVRLQLPDSPNPFTQRRFFPWLCGLLVLGNWIWTLIQKKPVDS